MGYCLLAIDGVVPAWLRLSEARTLVVALPMARLSKVDFNYYC